MKTKKLNWSELLKSGDAYCYLKPNRKVHDSGYRCFEIGYCTTDNARVKDKLVLGEYSDHIWTYSFDNPIKSISMDLLLDGYIRIWDFGRRPVWWGSFDWVVSSAQLEYLPSSNSEHKEEA